MKVTVLTWTRWEVAAEGALGVDLNRCDCSVNHRSLERPDSYREILLAASRERRNRNWGLRIELDAGGIIRP
jgi:hypothetical protein